MWSLSPWGVDWSHSVPLNRSTLLNWCSLDWWTLNWGKFKVRWRNLTLGSSRPFLSRPQPLLSFWTFFLRSGSWLSAGPWPGRYPESFSLVMGQELGPICVFRFQVDQLWTSFNVWWEAFNCDTCWGNWKPML